MTISARLDSENYTLVYCSEGVRDDERVTQHVCLPAMLTVRGPQKSIPHLLVGHRHLNPDTLLVLTSVK